MKRGFRSLKRASVGAAAAALAALGVSVVPSPSTAAAASTFFQFRLAGTSSCLQPQTGINSQIVTGTCNSSSTLQRWTALSLSGGVMEFVNPSSGAPCLTVHNNLTIPGAPIEAEECSSDPNKVWHLIAATAPSDGTFLIENPASRLCATILGGSFLGLGNCDLTSAAQKFTLNAV